VLPQGARSIARRGSWWTVVYHRTETKDDDVGKTEVRFTHAGLVPKNRVLRKLLERMGSAHQGNLRSLIATGKDQPDAFA